MLVSFCLCKAGVSGRVQGLSCLSGMTEKSVMRVQEETLLLVMQKRSL